MFHGTCADGKSSGLIVAPRLTAATGTADREAAIHLVRSISGPPRLTAGADKGYDTRDFVLALRALRATPHVARNCSRLKSAIDGRTTRHPGHALSQRVRKTEEEIFGWIKTVGNLRKPRHRGIARLGWMFTLTATGYNLVRMRNLMVEVSV